MWNDPIVAETRAIRDGIAARFNDDIGALMAYLTSLQVSDMNVLIANAVKKPATKAETAQPKQPMLISDKAP